MLEEGRLLRDVICWRPQRNRELKIAVFSFDRKRQFTVNGFELRVLKEGLKEDQRTATVSIYLRIPFRQKTNVTANVTCDSRSCDFLRFAVNGNPKLPHATLRARVFDLAYEAIKVLTQRSGLEA